MRDRTFERIGALSGLAFFVLAVLSGFIYPQQPRVDAAPAKTLAWVHDHHVALQAGMIFDFFAAGVLLWFAGYLYRVLRRAEGDVASLAPIVLASGIGVSITTAMAALPTVLLAFMDAQQGGLNDPSLVRALGDLNTIFFSLTSVMTAVFLAALGWAMLRGEPARWLGWLALLVAAFNCIAVWIGVTFSSYHGHAWLIIGWGAYVGFLVVMLITSVALRHPLPPRRADPSRRDRRAVPPLNAEQAHRGPFVHMASAARSARPARTGGATTSRRTRPLSRDYGGDPRSAELAESIGRHQRVISEHEGAMLRDIAEFDQHGGLARGRGAVDARLAGRRAATSAAPGPAPWWMRRRR